MIPILYAKNASVFTHNGIGYLKDAISCKAAEERNGEYTLTFTYPITGNYYSEITEGSIVKAKANETSGLQLFRIYKSSRPINGVVTFYARHISYDLIGLPITSLSAASTTPGAALTSGFNACPITHGFTAWSNISSLNSISISKPRSLRNLCGGEEGSVLSIWGGEFEFDNFVVKLHSARGSDTGVIIDYGKNLTDAKQERNINDTYTHFCPFAIKTVETYNEAGEITESHEEAVYLTEEVIALVNPENIGHSKALTLDITDKFAEGEEISEENLRTHAEAYIASHDLGKPKINITFSLLQLWDSPEYASFAALERVRLCDTITVRFADLGINAKAKVVKTEYDSLAERYTKLEVGDAKSTLADTVSTIEESIAEAQKGVAESKNTAFVDLNNAIIEATNKITGNSGGYVVLSPANNPQEILIMNTADKSTATKLWRFNLSGLGYSSTGYSGSYGLALTMDGAIVADFITTGTLRAIDISACTITGGTLNINDKFTVDASGNASVEGYIKATSGIIGGCSITNGVLDIPAVNVSGTLTASQIDVAGVITAGSANIETIITGKVTASYVEALSIEVAAANVTGTLTASQIDVAGVISAGGIAIQSDIPTATSELTNDSGFENATGVITLIDGRITADYIEALSIEVAAANITGTLTASQIDATNLNIAAGNITGTLTASQIDADGISATGVTISGAITATSGSLSTMTISGKLTFGNNSAYYIDANMNDARYYINLPGFKVDDANGAVFSGKLSAATGTFAGSLSAATGTFSGTITATAGIIGGSTYNWTIGTSGSTASIYCGTSSIPGIALGTSSNRAYIGTDGLSYSGDATYESTFGYTTVVKSGFMACSGDQNGNGQHFRVVKYGCAGIDFYYSGTTNPTSGSNGTFKGSLSMSNAGDLQLDGAALWSTKALNPYSSGSVDIGSSSHKWNDIYAVNATIQTSDENEKNSIEVLPESYSVFFDALSSIRYKFNAGTSNRFHCGLGAQGVINALTAAGLTTSDFAGVCISSYTDEETGETVQKYGLRYGEFISLCINEIQKLKARLAALEG